MSPARKVRDDALKRNHGCPDDFVVHVDGKTREKVEKVVSGHALGQDSGYGSHTRPQ